MEDVEEAVSLDPSFSSSEVSSVVGDPWIPTQRFEVVQKNKVRGVDSATVNGINTASSVSEKLDLPSTDVNVSALRWLRSNVVDQPISGWVLDERKAYRQIAIRPDPWSVIALRQPCSGRTAFFVMIGHSFGLVSSVYNYNRRSAAITDILRRIFGVAAFNFYDDKYGFEPKSTVESAFQCAQKVHWWLGAQFDAKKLQLSSAPTILGVTYALEGMRLLIKQKRKEEILDEIESIMSSGILPPGQAGKLRGRSPVQFGCEVAQTLIDEWIPRKSQIAMVELFATIVALETFKQELKGSSALLFVDSEPVQCALVKAREDMCELVSVFWRCALALRANFYIDRISTDANPADHPSRDRMDVGKKLGWIEVEPKFPSLQRGLSETFGS